MSLYIVMINNATVKKLEGIEMSFASLQLSMVDMSGYTGDTDSSGQEAPIMVIIIAVVVGGLISSFCLGVIIYMIVKAVKNRGKDFIEQPASPEESESLNSDQLRRKRLRANTMQGGPHGIAVTDVEQLDDHHDRQVKVLPEII